MIDDQRSVEAADPPATSGDPAGGVLIPPGLRAVIRAQILAGAVVGLNTIFGSLADITSPQTFIV